MANFFKYVQKNTAAYMSFFRQIEVLNGVSISARHSYLCVLGIHRAKKLKNWIMGVKMRPLLR